MLRPFPSLCLLGLLGMASGCNERPPEPTLSYLQDEVFSATCAFSSCHGAVAPQKGLSLMPGRTYAAVVNQDSTTSPGIKRVAPGDPDGSLLLQAVLGIAPNNVRRMPLNAPALDATRIQMLREWIAAGAPDN
jgi:hypothetical protein